MKTTQSKMGWLPGPIGLLALLLAGTVSGRDLFTFAITVDGSAIVRNGNNDLRDFLELFDDVSLKELFPQ